MNGFIKKKLHTLAPRKRKTYADVTACAHVYVSATVLCICMHGIHRAAIFPRFIFPRSIFPRSMLRALKPCLLSSGDPPPHGDKATEACSSAAKVLLLPGPNAGAGLSAVHIRTRARMRSLRRTPGLSLFIRTVTWNAGVPASELGCTPAPPDYPPPPRLWPGKRRRSPTPRRRSPTQRHVKRGAPPLVRTHPSPPSTNEGEEESPTGSITRGPHANATGLSSSAFRADTSISISAARTRCTRYNK